jgi:hypothetical protein
VDDPFQGAVLEGDCLRPTPLPGLGVRWTPGAGDAAAQVDAAGPKVAGSKVTRAKTTPTKAAPPKAAPAKAAPAKTVGSKAAGGRRSPSRPSKDNSTAKAQAKGPEA